MSKTAYEKVREFHETYGLLIAEKPEFPDDRTTTLRMNLIEEEFLELQSALADKDLVGVADALTDLQYVILGMMISYGIDGDKCFDEVHRSNMSKLDNGRVIRRPSDGKILKGPMYSPPNLEKILFGDKA